MCLLWQNMSWQKYACFCRDKHIFVTVKLLSLQAYFCRNKTHLLSQQTFVASKKFFVVTNVILLRQNVCCSKLLTWQKTWFVMTKVLSHQKWSLWQLLPMTDNFQKYDEVIERKALWENGEGKQIIFNAKKYTQSAVEFKSKAQLQLSWEVSKFTVTLVPCRL